MDQITELLTTILHAIVTRPEEIEMHTAEAEDQNGVYQQINVKVAKEDVGACIGKNGKNAEALRRIVALAGFKSLEQRVYVKIDAPKIPKTHFDYDQQFQATA